MVTVNSGQPALSRTPVPKVTDGFVLVTAEEDFEEKHKSNGNFKASNWYRETFAISVIIPLGLVLTVQKNRMFCLSFLLKGNQASIKTQNHPGYRSVWSLVIFKKPKGIFTRVFNFFFFVQREMTPGSEFLLVMNAKRERQLRKSTPYPLHNWAPRIPP